MSQYHRYACRPRSSSAAPTVLCSECPCGFPVTATTQTSLMASVDAHQAYHAHQQLLLRDGDPSAQTDPTM